MIHETPGLVCVETLRSNANVVQDDLCNTDIAIDEYNGL